MSIMIQTVTRLRAGVETDRYGNQVPSWDAASTLDISGCSLQPSDSSEIVADQQTTVSLWRLYAPAGADILATDRIRYAGVTYDVSQAPRIWPDPFLAGAGDHMEVTLKQIDPPVPS